MISIATMGRFVGPVPKSWDSGSSGLGYQIKYVDKKLPTINIRKIHKYNNKINITINNIKEE